MLMRLLWQSQIHPLTAANKLTEDELARLRENIIHEITARLNITAPLCTALQQRFGEAGEFQNELQVYGRVGEPCLRCGHPLEKDESCTTWDNLLSCLPSSKGLKTCLNWD